MVLFSFENITRAAGLNATNTLPVSDSARATHESFESHLQLATAPPPRESVESTSRNNRPSEKPSSSSTETRHNATARRDTDNQTKREDDRLVNNDAAVESTTKQPEKRSDLEPEREDRSDAEAVAAGTAAEQQATVQQLELAVTNEVDPEAVDVSEKQPAKASLEVDPLDFDAALSTDSETPEGELSLEEESEASNGKTNAQVEKKSKTDVALVDNPIQAVANGDTDETDASDLPANESQLSKPDLEESSSPANTRLERRGNRNEASANPTADPTQNPSAKSGDPAIVEAAFETATDESADQRRNPKEAEITKPVSATTSTDTTTATPGTPSRFAQHLLARTADPNGRGLSISDADQSRFVDRVARAVQATGERGGTLRLRLSPPELGSMTLEIKVQGGSVTARIEADTPAARFLLLENLPILRERLAEQGMRVDQFDVDLNDRQPGGTPDGLQQNDRQQQQDQPPAEHRSHDPDETARSQSPTTRTNGSGQLNIIV